MFYKDNAFMHYRTTDSLDMKNIVFYSPNSEVNRLIPICVYSLPAWEFLTIRTQVKVAVKFSLLLIKEEYMVFYFYFIRE